MDPFNYPHKPIRYGYSLFCVAFPLSPLFPYGALYLDQCFPLCLRLCLLKLRLHVVVIA
jgi:hypothetical protein